MKVTKRLFTVMLFAALMFTVCFAPTVQAATQVKRVWNLSDFKIGLSQQYTLKFDANGGSVTPASKNVVCWRGYGDLPTPTRSGYAFNGWYTAKSGGKKVDAKTIMPAKDVTIYAQWKKAFGYWTEIKIVGDAGFTQNTERALDIIRGSKSGYELVMNYIGVIKQVPQGSGMWAEEIPPTFQVGDVTSNDSETWYASSIVHDAYHSKLYHDYLQEHDTVPDDIWTGENAEMQCLTVQINFLKEIGAPQYEIDYAESMYGENWWSGEVYW